MNSDKLLINKSTGEITAEIYPGDRFSIVRKSQDNYASSHIINFNKEQSFVKIYDNTISILEAALTAPEFKFALCLIPHISYEDCIIRETQNRNSKILTIKDLSELHGYTYGNARKLSMSLKQKGIIAKHSLSDIIPSAAQQTVYTVNPFIFFRGSDILNTIYEYYSSLNCEELIQNSIN